MTSREGTPGLPERLPLIPTSWGLTEREKPVLRRSLPHRQRCPSSSLIPKDSAWLLFGDGGRSAAHARTRRDPSLPSGSRAEPLAVPAPPWHAESNGLSSAVMLAPFLEKARFQFTALLRNSSVFLPNLKRRLPRHSKFSDKPTVSALCISAKALPY